jgi:hypothetical protein
MVFEGIPSDIYDIIGTIIAVISVVIMYHMSRKGEENSNKKLLTKWLGQFCG